MPKYIIKDGKAIRVDKLQKVEEVKVEEKVEEEVLNEEKYLEEYTVKELKEIAEKYDIDAKGKTKQELIEEIKNKVGE
jgi:hypothetical protein